MIVSRNCLWGLTMPFPSSRILCIILLKLNLLKTRQSCLRYLCSSFPVSVETSCNTLNVYTIQYPQLESYLRMLASRSVLIIFSIKWGARRCTLRWRPLKEISVSFPNIDSAPRLPYRTKRCSASSCGAMCSFLGRGGLMFAIHFAHLNSVSVIIFAWFFWISRLLFSVYK